MPANNVNFAEWRKVRLNSRVAWRMNELSEAAIEGYSSRIGARNLIADTGHYLFEVLLGHKLPATLERLQRRAKHHNCLIEFERLLDTFKAELMYTRRYANESTEEFERIEQQYPF